MRRTMWAVAIAALLWTGVAAIVGADDSVTLKGTVTAVTRPMATLEADGKSYSLHLGPIWFWEKQGYGLEKGDAVAVTGLLAREGDRAHVYLRTMERGGETYVFADEDGAPLWARRAGRGPGMGAGRGPGGGPPAGAGPGCCPKCACPHCQTAD